MSQRPPVDRQRIQDFLMELGKRFRTTGRLYLVGGATMVYEGFRHQTLDIDLAFEIRDHDHTDFIRIIRSLKEKLSMNVEEASPKDFIPLPSGYQDRARFIGRFGHLDVFHFDLYSVALSKIERGRDSDFADVLSLLKAGMIGFDELRDYFEEILPRVSEFSLKADQEEFRRKFSYLEKTWQVY